MKQIYHNYLLWEDYKAGMYSSYEKEEYERLFNLAFTFTRDHIEYGKAMREVIKKWKYSCEHNLSNENINRKAWLGHAACALKHSLPENIVREAWGKLSVWQQMMANKEAEDTIKEWEKQFEPKDDLQLKLW